VAVGEVVGPFDFDLRDGAAAANSPENAVDSCDVAAIIASDAKMMRVVLLVFE